MEEVYDDDDRFNSPINPTSNDEPNLILPVNKEPCSGDSCHRINATFTVLAQFALKYLLQDGLEIGMSTGTCSNPQCFSLQYLINLILLLVRGESVAD